MKITNNHLRSVSTNTIILLVMALFAITVLMVSLILINDIKRLSTEIDELEARQETKNQIINSELEDQKNIVRPAYDTENNTLAFPKLKIEIPFSSVSNTFLYRNDSLIGVEFEDYEEGLRITSSLVGPNPKNAQLDCQQLVRLSIKDGTPYSPWEEYAGEVKLADGRTLYIIKAIAFENNEASTAMCAESSWMVISPDIAVEEFKKAQSY